MKLKFLRVESIQKIPMELVEMLSSAISHLSCGKLLKSCELGIKYTTKQKSNINFGKG